MKIPRALRTIKRFSLQDVDRDSLTFIPLAGFGILSAPFRNISRFASNGFLLSSLPNCMPAGCGCVSYRRWRREPRTRNGELPLPAAVVCRGIGRGACRRRSSAREFRSLKRGSCREGVLSCLPRGDRAGCDLVDCSQPHAGAGGPGICHAALYAGRRLVVRNCYCSAGSRPISPSCRGYRGSRSQIGCGKEISRRYW